MHELVIPKYVNPAKEGKKYGTIKLEDGTSYAVPASLISRFSPGVSADIEWAEQTWGKDKVRVVGGITAAPVAHVAASVVAAAATARPNGYATHTKDERLIFITGLAGRMLGSGRYRLDQMPDIVLGAAWCWNELCEHPEGKKPELEVDPMGDAYEGDLPEMRG